MNVNVYGALLNEGSRFYDPRLGQSVTLTGRCITRHMLSTINQILTGEYDHEGKSIIYGDSVTGDTVVNTSVGDMTISELFEICDNKWNDRDKDFAVSEKLKVLAYNQAKQTAELSNFDYVCKHKTNKEQWLIEDENGNQIRLTNDHSLMVERDGIVVEIKPSELLEDDILITYS